MKAIICLPILSKSRMSEGFQGISGPLLPLGNKPLLEYYIGICAVLKISEILVLDNDYSMEVASVLQQGQPWGVKLDYRGAGTVLSLDSLLLRNKAFLNGESAVVFNGLFFPLVDYRELENATIESLDKEDFPSTKIADGIFHVGGDRCRTLNIDMIPLRSYKDYFESSMRLVKSSFGEYPIPGYHINNGIYIGMDVTLPPTCEVETPGIIGNNVRFSNFVGLNGNVIIGNRVLVENNTILENAVVTDYTYLGADLEIRNKIVCRDRVIDPFTEAVLRLDDECLLMDVKRFRLENSLSWILDSILALLLIILMTPLFLLFMMLGKYERESKAFTSVCSHTHYYTRYKLNFANLRDVYFHKLMIDKYLRLFYIFCGDLVLFGESIERMPEPGELSFLPGVFSFSDTYAGGSNPLQMKLDDRYYRYNKNFRLMLKCLISSIVTRILSSPSDYVKR